MRCLFPGQDALDSRLELEDHTYSGIETAEVEGHGGDIEVWSFGLSSCLLVAHKVDVVLIIIIGRYNLLQKSIVRLVGDSGIRVSQDAQHTFLPNDPVC